MPENLSVFERSTWSIRHFVLHALAETIRFAEQFHDVGVVCQPVEQGCGQAFVSKDLDPIGEFQVGGHHQSDPFMQGRAKLEHQLGPGGGKRDEAPLIPGLFSSKKY